MPTPVNPGLLIAGPCIVQHKNKTFYSKGNVQLLPRRTTFGVGVAPYGILEQRENQFSYEVKFTPVGRLDALTVLWPHGAVRPGELVHAVLVSSAVNTGTDVLTVPSTARIRDGAPVRLGLRGAGTVHTGLVAGTQYFAHVLTSTTLSLHTTEAGAIANTGKVDITAAGTAIHVLTEEEYLVIQTLAGEKYTFVNAAITGVPEMDLSPDNTAIGEVTFECFRAFNTAQSNAASFYTKSLTAFTDTSFDPSAIVTDIFDMAWGATAPWAAISTRGGIRANFDLGLEAWGDDTGGLISRKISSLGCSVRARPIGIDNDDIQAALVVQGAGAGRGRRIVSANHLNITSASGVLGLRVYGAILSEPGAINYDAVEERVSELTWTAQRIITAGAFGPLYYVAADLSGAPAN